MKIYLAILAATILSGCANTNMDWLFKGPRYGYADYDPCIRCGEKYDQLPNQPFEAQARRARGEQW